MIKKLQSTLLWKHDQESKELYRQTVKAVGSSVQKSSATDFCAMVEHQLEEEVAVWVGSKNGEPTCWRLAVMLSC